MSNPFANQSSDRPPSDDDILAHVRAASNDLLNELEDGCRQTNNWANAAETKVIVDRAMQRLLDRLNELQLWGKANQRPSSELWRIAGDVLKVGTLQLHARTKPHGYAGDFEMLKRICDNDHCDHPLGRAFDRFFQNRCAPQAVRNRVQMIADEIVRLIRRRKSNDTFHVVSVGSGPAIDVHRAAQLLTNAERQEMKVTLLDLDPAALEYAKENLCEWLPEENVNCVRTNLYRIAQNATLSRNQEPADFLFCTGLFDYLNDDDAASMLAEFWKCLSADGSLMVFNFGPQNTSRDYMEWIGNWYLIYRDVEDMAELARRARLPNEHVRIGSEPLGANLFLRSQKDSDVRMFKIEKD